jgi:cell wall-associated NlpC family hydrolase
VSIDSFGPMAVQARIAEIQSRFTPVGTVQTAAATSRGTAAAATGGQGSTLTTQRAGDFAAALARLNDLSAIAAPGSSAGAGATDSVAGQSDSAPVAVTGSQVVADARKYLGVPYVWGGTDPAKGLDCSGLVQRVYGDLGIDLPRVSQDQAHVGQAVPSLAQARPGDLLCFGTPADHIGIYIGGSKMIVAPKTGDVVKVQDVYRTPSTIRRVLPDSAPVTRMPVLGTPVAGAPASGGAAAPSPALAAAPAAYRSLFEEAGRRHGVPAALLAAVAKVESGFNRAAVSGAGARGLMQLMPGTARGLGVDPMDPAQAVDGAARLLATHLRTYGSVPLALAAYNAGPGAVNRYNGVPPYAETQAYVTKVQAAMTGAAA